MLAACLRRAGPGNEPAALREYAVPAPGAHHPDARVLPGQPAQQPDQRPGPGPGAQRLLPRARAAQPGRAADAGMAARARPGRRRASSRPRSSRGAWPCPANPMRRPEARRAFDLWRTALTGEHRAAGWLGERAGLRGVRAGPTAPGRRGPAGRRGARLRRRRPRCGSGARRGRRAGLGRPVVLHLHGGGYSMGSARAVGAARRTAGARRSAAGRSSPDYRLAPEHPFPAALDDVARRLPLAGPPVPAGPGHRQRRVRGRRARAQPRPGAARLRRPGPAGCPRASTSSRRSATWRCRRSTSASPPTPTRGSTGSR